MKEYTLVDTYREVEYQEYLDFCECNEITPQNEDSNEFLDFQSKQIENDVDDFFANLKYNKELPTAWVVTGTLGLWNGRPEVNVILFKELDDVIRECLKDCDYFRVVKKGNLLDICSSHHDGTNYFEVRGLSDIGKDRYYRNGKISINNRENICKLPEYLN